MPFYRNGRIYYANLGRTLGRIYASWYMVHGSYLFTCSLLLGISRHLVHDGVGLVGLVGGQIRKGFSLDSVTIFGCFFFWKGGWTRISRALFYGCYVSFFFFLFSSSSSGRSVTLRPLLSFFFFPSLSANVAWGLLVSPLAEDVLRMYCDSALCPVLRDSNSRARTPSPHVGPSAQGVTGFSFRSS